MKLTDEVRDADTLLALQPEQLAPLVLRVIREHVRLSPSGFNWCTFTYGVEGDYGTRGAECALAASAALTYLQNLGILVHHPSHQQWGWYALSARGLQIATPEDFTHLGAISLYPRGRIHPEIERRTFSDFVAGEYESAVFKAFKAVEARVRDKGGYTDADYGTVLMAKAFGLPDGKLTDSSEQPSESEALRKLYSGAIGRFKNPSSHRFVGYSDPAVVVEMLGLASILMRRLDG